MGYRALKTANISITDPDGSAVTLDVVEGQPVDFDRVHTDVLVRQGSVEYDPSIPDPPPPGVYDPSEHSVDEVNAYLDEHPEMVAQVLSDEAAASKPRKGIVEGPHAASDQQKEG